jgi:hypothetical protein
MTDTSELLYQQACYWTKEGVRVEIDVRELATADGRERAAKHELFDLDGINRLSFKPGTGAKQPHFALRIGERQAFIYDRPRSDIHDKRVQELSDTLRAFRQSNWFLQTWSNDTDNATTSLECPAYVWEKEVTRGVGSKSYLRHDIFGCHLDFRTSYLRPSIAIEVIDTHYPEELVFAAMLAQSKHSPLLVLFDHVKVPGRFVRAYSRTRRLMYSSDAFLIQDGAVWRDGKALKINNVTELRYQLESYISRLR